MDSASPRHRGTSALALGVSGVIFAAAALPANAHDGTAGVPVANPPSIIERMGMPMGEPEARHEIAFRPFAPPRRILGVALLPPFHGSDERVNRGIGFEYADVAGRRYALAEWPANGGTIARFAPLVEAEPDCPDAHTFSRGAGPRGIVWSTSRGLVMTLQADGANDARTLEWEWRKLIRRGACR
jgi:hypothetical protein